MTFRSLVAACAAVLVAGMAVTKLAARADSPDSDVRFEIEPNDSTPETLDTGAGARPGAPLRFRIKGWIDSIDDLDRFALVLAPGDVVGATVTDTSSLDPRIRMRTASAELVIGGDDVPKVNLPDDSPLPNAKGPVGGGHAGVYTVIAAAGTYVLEIAGESGTTGRYRLDVVVARPALEEYPVGTRQIVFVDFDGAVVNMTEFSLFGGSGTKTLSPMSDFLGAWGLGAADEDAVVDAVLDTLEESLSTLVRMGGRNGDYASTGIPGTFDIEIRNSRDHADTYGLDPLVTRLIIGGTQAQGGVNDFAANSTLDPGNFRTDDDTYVMLDQLAGLTSGVIDRDLNQFGFAAGWTKAELVGTALGRIGAHELAHTFGCFHTESSNTVFDIMDRGTPYGFDPAGTGPDGILGTADDVVFAFGIDAYDSREPLLGAHDALNTIAFGLATGRQ